MKHQKLLKGKINKANEIMSTQEWGELSDEELLEYLKGLENLSQDDIDIFIKSQ